MKTIIIIDLNDQLVFLFSSSKMTIDKVVVSANSVDYHTSG